MTGCCRYMSTRKHVICHITGDPDAGPQAEPGFRSRGPGLEKPAAGEGEDVTLTGGNQSISEELVETCL